MHAIDKRLGSAGLFDHTRAKSGRSPRRISTASTGRTLYKRPFGGNRSRGRRGDHGGQPKGRGRGMPVGA